MHAAVAWGGDFYFDFSESVRAGGVWRGIAEHILFAEIAGDGLGNGGDGFALCREVGQASGVLAKALEKIGIFFFVVGTEEGEGIDDRLGLARLRENLRVLEMAGVVSAVADDDEGVFFEMGILQVVEGFADGIVEGGASAGGDGVKGF